MDGTALTATITILSLTITGASAPSTSPNSYTLGSPVSSWSMTNKRGVTSAAVSSTTTGLLKPSATGAKPITVPGAPVPSSAWTTSQPGPSLKTPAASSETVSVSPIVA